MTLKKTSSKLQEENAEEDYKMSNGNEDEDEDGTNDESEEDEEIIIDA